MLMMICFFCLLINVQNTLIQSPELRTLVSFSDENLSVFCHRQSLSWEQLVILTQIKRGKKHW